MKDYGRSRNRNEISETGGCVVDEEQVYATYESGAEKRTRKGSVLIGCTTYEEKVIWVRKYYCCFLVL